MFLDARTVGAVRILTAVAGIVMFACGAMTWPVSIVGTALCLAILVGVYDRMAALVLFAMSMWSRWMVGNFNPGDIDVSAMIFLTYAAHPSPSAWGIGHGWNASHADEQRLAASVAMASSCSANGGFACRVQRPTPVIATPPTVPAQAARYLWGVVTLFAAAKLTMGAFYWHDWLRVSLISVPTLLMIAALFVPRGLWDRAAIWLERRPATHGFRLYFDGACGFCFRGCRIIQELGLVPGVRIDPCQGDPEIEALMTLHNSWVVVDARGGKHVEYDACCAVVDAMPLFWWLAPAMRFAPMKAAGLWFYREVSHNRGRYTALLSLLEPRVPKTLDAAIGLAMLALALSAMTLDLMR